MAVSLRTMSDSEALHAVNAMLEGYVADRVRAGEPESVAREIEQAQVARYFPDGRPADGHVLFAVHDDAEQIGMLWVGPHPKAVPGTAWIFDIEIDEAHRGHGYGREALALAEEHARADGYDQLGLNVFGDNDVARNLYRGAGYREATVQMTKRLGT